MYLIAYWAQLNQRIIKCLKNPSFKGSALQLSSSVEVDGRKINCRGECREFLEKRHSTGGMVIVLCYSAMLNIPN